jgi:LysM repeat protein
MIDSLEKEDAIYLFEHQQMRKQNGYFIYYEKNSAMREYMLAGEKQSVNMSSEQEKRTEIRRDRKIVNSYRRMNHYRKDNKKQDVRVKAIRAACGVLIFIMGFYIAGKLGNRFVNMGIEDYAITTFQAMRNVFLPEITQVKEELQSGDKAELLHTEEVSEDLLKEESENPNVNTESDKGTENHDDVEDEIKETVSYPKPLYYTVRKGDTLAAISRKMYSTDRYMDQIARANNLSNIDEIYEGQKIIIPSLE